MSCSAPFREVVGGQGSMDAPWTHWERCFLFFPRGIWWFNSRCTAVMTCELADLLWKRKSTTHHTIYTSGQTMQEYNSSDSAGKTGLPGMKRGTWPTSHNKLHLAKTLFYTMQLSLNFFQTPNKFGLLTFKERDSTGSSPKFSHCWPAVRAEL